ncbi:hypothetical protein U1Q18_044445 [Sarracenia purpurea var. burkii]
MTLMTLEMMTDESLESLEKPENAILERESIVAACLEEQNEGFQWSPRSDLVQDSSSGGRDSPSGGLDQWSGLADPRIRTQSPFRIKISS